MRSASTWSYLSDAEAERHPNYGVRGWLTLLFLILLVGVCLYGFLAWAFFAFLLFGLSVPGATALGFGLLAAFALNVTAIVLLVKRSRWFPIYFLAYVGASVVTTLLDLAIDGWTYGEVIYLSVIIGFAGYVQFSVRPNVTFRRRARSDDAWLNQFRSDYPPDRQLPPLPGQPPAAVDKIASAVVTPIRALRWRYVPLLMVYFAYGVYISLIATAVAFWIRKSLTLSAAELAAIVVWLQVPWTIKMVFGQFVDSIPILGSRRRIYVFIGGGMIAGGLVLLAGAAGGWITFASPEALYIIASLAMTIGIVLQDVVADAMSTEVVERTDAEGKPRPENEVRRDLAMVQVLGRLALSFGLFAASGLGGWLASVLPYDQVFLIGLVVPALSITGVLFINLEAAERLPIDWRVLGGGLVFGAVVVALGVLRVPFGQEIVFAISMVVVCLLLVMVTEELDRETRLQILYATIIIFAFRATPTTGEGARWFQMDVLGFDEAFFGVLAQVSSTFAIVGMWLLADTIAKRPIAQTLLWLTILYTVLSFPNLSLYYGLHEWTERHLGFGAQTIALIDTAAESPFAQLSMIPLLTLIAIYAPPGRRATWFALMASLMNLALTAGAMQTKYLNQVFEVPRGQYGELGWLLITVVVVNFVVPIAAIALFGRRIVATKPA